jgi:hypothetical protein
MEARIAGGDVVKSGDFYIKRHGNFNGKRKRHNARGKNLLLNNH